MSDGGDASATRSAALSWKVPALLVALAAVIGALPPLHEIDLSQHLAMGEWIVRNRAVPFVEPFAWTREGQPYFAYSWLVQLLMFVLLRAFGPIGLHVLEGLVVGGSVAAAWWAARRLGWRSGAVLVVAVLHLALLWGVASTLRPQQVLFLAVPLAWGVAAVIRDRGPSAGRLAGLAGIGALAANTHIFFPLTAAPIAYFLIVDRDTRRWLTAGAALAVGWLISPYALAWPQVFALNFGHNILLGRPPSIAEFVPGLEYAMHRPGVILTALVLVAAPWLSGWQDLQIRERVGRMLFWTVGVMLFAYAGRLILVWWMLAFPLVGDIAHRILGGMEAGLARPFSRVAAGGLAAILLVVSAPQVSPAFWLFEGDTVHRMLPRGGEDPALWLPSWLLCNTLPGAHGKIFTEFNYGSELNWRLPGYSPSIDGRTIFPDSIAVDFSFQPYGRRPVHATTWRHADLALLDGSFWAVPELNADSAWVLLAQGRRWSHGGVAGLWAKREWWSRWSTTGGLPALDVHPGDPRGTCAATGVFPKP